MIETNENYWDCECEEDYIHEKAKKKYCARCDTYFRYRVGDSVYEQPDSREDEINHG
jgi:hypothetical protein